MIDWLLIYLLDRVQLLSLPLSLSLSLSRCSSFVCSFISVIIYGAVSCFGVLLML